MVKQEVVITHLYPTYYIGGSKKQMGHFTCQIKVLWAGLLAVTRTIMCTCFNLKENEKREYDIGGR
jgi:hypothetical protein